MLERNGGLKRGGVIVDNRKLENVTEFNYFAFVLHKSGTRVAEVMNVKKVPV